MTERERRRREDMSAEDVARLDEREYAEPGRDIRSTRPADEGPGDVDNPVAETDRPPHHEPPNEAHFGTDEDNVMARKKRWWEW